jgi:ribonucleoside-diphosphate reductase alpha chain
MTGKPSFQAPISKEIWNRKYRFSGSDGFAADSCLDDTFWRVARAAASVEKGGKSGRERWARAFHSAMADWGFLPGGRILAGAGTGRDVTLFNCFVLGKIEDDLGAIFDSVKDAALTMQSGGGIGHDFSTLRPKGALVKSIGADASGPVSFMDVWDAMCRTIMSAGQRRGAMMATLRCDHPDIEDFIAAKSEAKRLRNFNLSVLVTDGFMDAVNKDAPWDLKFDGKVYRTISARGLWDKLMHATYDYAEPGAIFIDRVNAENNLAYCETISATNPCGEQPLPAFGACLLGSINLASLVEQPFTADARIDDAKLSARVGVAVRLLDNIIDVSRYPLEQQGTEARAKRRIGLGITGLADALIFCGLLYSSDAARTKAAHWMSVIQNAAYAASADLAAEKGAFPLYKRDDFLDRPNVRRLSPSVRKKIAAQGLRNGCLTSIAPTGTISLLAGNVSSGIEPVFGFTYRRRVLGADGVAHEEDVEDFAFLMFKDRFDASKPLPEAFVVADALTPAAHLAMQAAMQPYVDSAISKTINCPQDITFEAFRDIYSEAYAAGLKGCTTYRPNSVTGAVLTHTSTLAAKAASLNAEAPITADAAPQPQSRGVVYMTKPLQRDAALEGLTYKIKWPASPHALYVTINDIVRDGRRRPFEIFINTKNLEHYAWTVALTRMISAVFRRGGDVTFVAEELKAVFDPEGGRWMGGRYVPSLLAAIGDVIEEHMIRTGFLVPDNDAEAISDRLKRDAAGADSVHPAWTGEGGASQDRDPESGLNIAAVNPGASARSCPRCGNRSLVRIEGCWTCTDCTYSHCG